MYCTVLYVLYRTVIFLFFLFNATLFMKILVLTLFIFCELGMKIVRCLTKKRGFPKRWMQQPNFQEKQMVNPSGAQKQHTFSHLNPHNGIAKPRGSTNMMIVEDMNAKLNKDACERKQKRGEKHAKQTQRT